MTKISDLSAITAASIDTAADLVTVVDMSLSGTARNKKMTFAELLKAVYPSSPSQGDVIYFNGTAWARLAAGTSGQFLKTQGAGANPVWASASAPTETIIIACSDESTAITTGTAKVTFRMPYAFTLTAVRASVTTAPTGSTIIIDINESGTTVLSTKLSIDASEKTSTTAASAAVISDASLADDAEITIDFDQVGSTIAGAGVKVYLIGHQ